MLKQLHLPACRLRRAEGGAVEFGQIAVEMVAGGEDVEDAANLLGDFPAATHALAKFGDVQLAAVRLAD